LLPFRSNDSIAEAPQCELCATTPIGCPLPTDKELAALFEASFAKLMRIETNCPQLVERMEVSRLPPFL